MRLTHVRLQTAVSFVAGLMLGMALLHFIPHAIHQPLRGADDDLMPELQFHSHDRLRLSLALAGGSGLPASSGSLELRVKNPMSRMWEQRI
jgi:hypothetical protein